MNIASSITQRVFFLCPSDEMRYPYESSMAPHGIKLTWFESLDELIRATAETPNTVIIDMDVVGRSPTHHLEQIRTHFAQSDLIAISTNDSAKLALQCIQSGFSDFLIKPLSPEELVWSIRKAGQRQDLFRKLEDKNGILVRALAQISSAATPTLVRLGALEFLKTQCGAEGAAWLEKEPQTGNFDKILASTPRNIVISKLKQRIQRIAKKDTNVSEFRIWKNAFERKITIPCRKHADQAVLLWGIKKKLSKKITSDLRILVEHSELCLLNIQRFEEIKQQTFLDDLTGLYNARYLKYALNNSIQKCKTSEDSFAVMFIDVDHFKKVNDGNGHLVGSDFLVAIGRTIRNAVRGIDPVFRYGGDEFVVILNDSTTDGAIEIAERIRRNVERRVFLIHGRRLNTTVSIGIASYPQHAQDCETLLKLADEAMYHAKKESRNAVHLAYGLPSLPEIKKKAA